MDYNKTIITAWRMAPRMLCFLSFAWPYFVFYIQFELRKEALSFNMEIQISKHTNE